jgi:hypothetical protein
MQRSAPPIACKNKNFTAFVADRHCGSAVNGTYVA